MLCYVVDVVIQMEAEVKMGVEVEVEGEWASI